MDILAFIKEYWAQILFLIGTFSASYACIRTCVEATKCSLRNDILEIYSQCKDTKTVTLYQLQAVELSYSLYKKLKGNSFVDSIVKEMRSYTRV